MAVYKGRLVNQDTGDVMHPQTSADMIVDDASHRFVTDAEKTAWNAKANASHTHNYAGSSTAGGAATTALACTGNSATATKATQDSTGQQINKTYIKNLSVSGRTITYTRGDGTSGTITTQDTNTTYSNMKGASTSTTGTAGLVPAPSAGSATRFLRSDGTWAVPPDTNTTYTLASFGLTATATELNYMDGVTGNVQTQLNNKMQSTDLSSTYFEKKSDGKYGLKAIPLEWFPAGSRILSGALSNATLYTMSGNAVRMELDIAYGDKGILNVYILDNRGVSTAGVIYWVKAGTSVNVIAKMLMPGSKDIVVRYSLVSGNTLILDLGDIGVYSSMYVSADKSIMNMYSINV